MAPETRAEIVSLKLSKEERQMLKGLTASTGLSQSDVLRQGLRLMWRQEQAKGPAPKPKK
jgi:Arc/MetJ-type ribon-helix-helix transcriptional regulator